MQVAERARAFARRQPWPVLAALVAVQWLVVAVFALTVQRNGWLFYQGGDQSWFYTSGWVLAGGHIPETFVGWVWPVVMLPIAGLAGPSYLVGVPAIVIVQFLFLLPVSLLCVYAIASRIGGRALGYWAAAWWVVVPFAVEFLFVERYRDTWHVQVLPQAFGLTGLGDYPSMVALLAAAAFFVRALETRARPDIVAAGLVTGIAIGIKPSNGLFVLAPLVGFALARRWRAVAGFGLALVPALFVLAVWKERGSGIALLALEPVHLAAAAEIPDFSPPTFWERVGSYLPLDFHQLNHQFLGFREFFWSARMLELVPVAGVVAVARRSVPLAGFLGVWLGSFFAIKGSLPAVNVESGSLWRFMMPAWPAYFLLGAALPLLVPRLGAELIERLRAPRVWRPGRPLVAAAFAAFVLPAIAFVALPSDDTRDAAKFEQRSLFVPLDDGYRPSGKQGRDGRLELTWPRADGYAHSFYVVLRSPLSYRFPATRELVLRGQLCREPGGAIRCSIEMEEAGRTTSRLWRELPPKGSWTYRVGIAANWLDDPDEGDILVVSGPLDVTVR